MKFFIAVILFTTLVILSPIKRAEEVMAKKVDEVSPIIQVTRSHRFIETDTNTMRSPSAFGGEEQVTNVILLSFIGLLGLLSLMNMARNKLTHK